MFDIIIIGAGVSGSACARELSRYKANILVLEKEEDVCCGTTKANSAIVHAGYDAATGSLMAKLNVQGSQMMEQLQMIYVIPDFQNPTGRTRDLERRHKFMEIVNRYEIPVVEDNPYGELRFAGEEIPTLKSMDTEGLVIYCSSFLPR